MSNRFQVRKQLHSKISNSKCQIPSPHLTHQFDDMFLFVFIGHFGLRAERRKKKKKKHPQSSWLAWQRAIIAGLGKAAALCPCHALVCLLFFGAFSFLPGNPTICIQQFLSRLEEFSKVEVEDWKSFWFFLVSFRWVPFGCKVVGICKGDYWCPLLEEGIYVSWESSFCLQ